jgi:SAM-dependent methyltransferase
MMQRVLRAVGLKSRPWDSYARSEYKSVWNAISPTEEKAKLAVSGTLDAIEHARSAHQTLEWLQRYVGVHPRDVIVDIGAGFGRVGEKVAPLCKRWIGTDVSENMVAVIKRRLAAHKNVEAVATNGFDLSPIASASADMVYCTTVFMHLDEWERYNYIVEGFRILKPGGRMIVDNISLATDQGWNIFIEHTKIPPAQRPPSISKMSTPQEIAIYFSRAGFQRVNQAELGPMTITYGHKPAG